MTAVALIVYVLAASVPVRVIIVAIVAGSAVIRTL